jgi:broad specificity phosphatase PhoE
MSGAPGTRAVRVHLVASGPSTSDGVRAIRALVGRWTAAARGPEPAAEATASALAGGSVETTEALRALSLGAWDGRPLDQVLAEDPEAARRWRSDPDWAPPAGESLAELCRRVEAWMEARVDERVLAVADATVVRAAAVVALGAGPASCWRLDVGPLTVVRVQRHDATWRLRAVHPAGTGAATSAASRSRPPTS